jgi:hypothetical protein
MKEALKLGLEALCVAVEPKKGKVYAREFEPIDCFAMHEQAITAIKEALAQPEQEPVAWLTEERYAQLHTAQRTWVGLTDKEMMQIYIDLKSVAGFYSVEKYARDIEAKLRSKNEN